MASHNALHPCILPPLSNFKMGCMSNPSLRNTHFRSLLRSTLKESCPFRSHALACFQVTYIHPHAFGHMHSKQRAFCVTRLETFWLVQWSSLQFLLAMLLRGELLTRSRKKRRPTTRPSYLLLCKMHCLCFPNPCVNTYTLSQDIET